MKAGGSILSQRPLVVAAHDAGACNAILGWLDRDDLQDVRAFVSGPAERLWNRAFPGQAPYPVLDEALEGARLLVSGTGWASDLEHVARKRARERKIRSIGVIDHWVNYRERFIRNGECILPDEFWVLDEMAEELARAAFPGHRITRQPNVYLLDLLAQITPPPGDGGDLLYVLEPARNDWGRGTPGEFQALDYLLANLEALQLPQDVPIRLRPHPSDSAGKYDAWIRRHPGARLVVDSSTGLAEAISRATWVAGCETFALVAALAARRQVICTLPPWAPECRLPQRGLLHLKKLARTRLPKA